MTGTFEHRGGSPAHDKTFDHEDGITPLEEEIGIALESLQRLQGEFDAAKEDLTEKLSSLMAALLPEGAVVQRSSKEWGRVTTVRGNDRRAAQFEIVGKPRITTFDATHPEFTRAQVDVYPLNDKGERLSGRAGNTRSYTGRGGAETCTVLFCVNGYAGFDDPRSGNDILLDFVHRATTAGAK